MFYFRETTSHRYSSELAEVKVPSCPSFRSNASASFYRPLPLIETTIATCRPRLSDAVFHTNACPGDVERQGYNATECVNRQSYKDLVSDLINASHFELCGRDSERFTTGEKTCFRESNQHGCMARMTQLGQEGFVKISNEPALPTQLL